MLHSYRVSLLISCLALMVAAPAMAGVSVEWTADEAGHIDMWWTEEGTPVEAAPFVVGPMDPGFMVVGVAPNDNIDGIHENWFGAHLTTTHLVTGYPPPTPSFIDVLGPLGGQASWLTLADKYDFVDVMVEIDMAIWAPFIVANPMPAPSSFFITDGYCPDLPGYYVTDGVTGATFNGELVAVGTGVMTVPEPISLSLMAAGSALLIRRRRK